MFLPAHATEHLPMVVATFLNNGLILGSVVGILTEQLLIWRKKEKCRKTASASSNAKQQGMLCSHLHGVPCHQPDAGFAAIIKMACIPCLTYSREPFAAVRQKCREIPGIFYIRFSFPSSHTITDRLPQAAPFRCRSG